MLDNLKLPEELPECVEATVKAAALPPAQSFGKGFADILNLVFYPFSNAAERIKIKQKYNLEQYEKRIIEKYSEIPEEKKTEPNFQIIASALEASKYSLDEETIRNMYANLIVNSMNSDFLDILHPSYSEVIKQLTPRDASNLSIFKTISRQPISKYIVYTTSSKAEFKIIQTNVFLSNKLYGDIYQQSVSVSNLERLNLVEITYSEFLTNPKSPNGSSVYDIFKGTKSYKEIEHDSQNSCDIQKGIIRITPYGQSFLKLCCD